MGWEEYLIFLGAILLCAVFAAYASGKVRKTFDAFSHVDCASKMTGYDTARRLLRANGITDISVGKVKGMLTDHYHPKKKKVNLSESVYGACSVGAVAVAAHEIGHVVQKKKGYFPYRLRTALVPVVNIGSRLALPLVLVGVLLDVLVVSAQESGVGFTLAIVGVCLYGAATLFQLVTLPVEWNASKRAKQMLLEEGILTESELSGADKVLSAAALTYVAGLLSSLVYFLRFFVWVLAIFGRRRR